MENREIIYEVFTVYGWTEVSFETYRNHSGKKRWRWADEEEGEFDEE